jgi:hypothetical protein
MSSGEYSGMEPLFSGEPSSRTAFERTYDGTSRTREEIAIELVKSLPMTPFETGYAERHGDNPATPDDETPEGLNFSA